MVNSVEGGSQIKQTRGRDITLISSQELVVVNLRRSRLRAVVLAIG